MIDIGSRRECFFDTWLLNTKKTTADLRLHQPVRKETVMIMDQPWEGDGSVDICLVQGDGRFYLYYIAGNMKKILTEEPDRYLHCCAESEDGIHWHRSNLGMYNFQGSTDNNILSGRDQKMHSQMFVFYDRNPACPPEERYRAIVSNLERFELFSVPSADGIHFDYTKRTVITTEGFFDCLNICFWDEVAKKYRCYFRGFHIVDGYDGDITDIHHQDMPKLRDIRYVESEDFVHWSKPQLVDMGDAEDIELYENKIMPYYRAPHMQIGLPTRYVARKNWTANYDGLTGREKRLERYERLPRFGLDLTDCTFMCARDGLHFHRFDEAFIRPGPENGSNWVYGDGYPAYGMFETPSDVPGAEPEISILMHSKQWIDNIELVRYTIRRDGFASLHAPGAKEETVVTKQFRFDGDAMYANFSTSAKGYLYFTLTAWDGTSIASCEVFGDATDRKIPFPEGAVASMRGRGVTLQVRMRDADLYAIRFGPA